MEVSEDDLETLRQFRILLLYAGTGIQADAGLDEGEEVLAEELFALVNFLAGVLPPHERLLLLGAAAALKECPSRGTHFQPAIEEAEP